MRHDDISSLQWSDWRSAATEEAARLAMEKAWPQGSLYAQGDDAEILMTIGPESAAPLVAEARAIIGQGAKIARWEYRVRVRSADG